MHHVTRVDVQCCLMTIEKTEEELAQTERRQPRYSFVRMLSAANVCACVCTVQATEAEWGAGSDRADFRYTKLSLSSSRQLCNSVHTDSAIVTDCCQGCRFRRVCVLCRLQR